MKDFLLNKLGPFLKKWGWVIVILGFIGGSIALIFGGSMTGPDMNGPNGPEPYQPPMMPRDAGLG